MKRSMVLAAALVAAMCVTINAQGQVSRLSSAIVSEQGLSATSKSMLSKLRDGLAVVNIELQRLDKNAFAGDYITVTLGGRDHTYKKQSQQNAPDGSVVWSGMEVGANGLNGGSAIFNVNGGNVWATIQAGGDVFEIQPIEGETHSVIHRSTAKFNFPEHLPSHSSIERRPISWLGESGLAAMRASDDPAVRAAATASNPPVRILVAYSDNALAFFGSAPALNAAVNTAIAQINTANENSTVPFRAQLVGPIKVSYAGPYDAASVLNAFKSMPAVLAAHDSMQADLMVMIEQVPATSDAGLSATINASPANAFAVVGTQYMTANQSFAHEVGHLMGADHDQQDTTSDVFHMGHGFWAWQQADSSSNFSFCGHTIMSYAIGAVKGGVGKTNYFSLPPNCAADLRIPYWSNPQLYRQIPASAITVRWGTVGTNDNAQLLANQGPIFTNYHLTQLSGRSGIPTPPNCRTNPRACAVAVTPGS